MRSEKLNVWRERALRGDGKGHAMIMGEWTRCSIERKKKKRKEKKIKEEKKGGNGSRDRSKNIKDDDRDARGNERRGKEAQTTLV